MTRVNKVQIDLPESADHRGRTQPPETVDAYTVNFDPSQLSVVDINATNMPSILMEVHLHKWPKEQKMEWNK